MLILEGYKDNYKMELGIKDEKIVNKFVKKLLKYRIMFKEINTYRKVISHKNLLLKNLKSACLKWTYGHSNNDYKLYLSPTGIPMKWNSNMPKVTEKTDGPNIIIKSFAFKNHVLHNSWKETVGHK